MSENRNPYSNPGFAGAVGSTQAPDMRRMRQMLIDGEKSSEKMANSWKQGNNISDGMNKSFQGMQAKAGAIQKIVGATLDAFAVGVSKTQKDVVNVMKKALQEGDFAAMAQGLIDMRFQFVKLEQLAAPWIAAFEPINDVLGTMAEMAAGLVYQSKEFQDFIGQAFSPQGISDMWTAAQGIADAVMELVNMNWEDTLTIIKEIIGGIKDFIDFVSSVQTGISTWAKYAPKYQG